MYSHKVSRSSRIALRTLIANEPGFIALRRVKAARSDGLNSGYALATNNMNRVGSCGEGYLMMNLLWGYK